jgi:hypothetical protein
MGEGPAAWRRVAIRLGARQRLRVEDHVFVRGAYSYGSCVL